MQKFLSIYMLLNIKCNRKQVLIQSESLNHTSANITNTYWCNIKPYTLNITPTTACIGPYTNMYNANMIYYKYMYEH